MRINAPQGALSAELREKIVEYKGRILEYLRHSAPESNFAQPIPRAKANQPVPLSFAQERVWFLQQVDPDAPLFNLCRAVKITGPLDIGALKSSLNQILRRHETLRTKFFVMSGQPMQRSARFAPVSLPVIDLTARSEAQRQRESQKLTGILAREPFDLTRGRLLRVELLRYSREEHVLVFCTHHIVADAWSMGIFASELWTLFQAQLVGTRVSLPELPIQYRDYASWQKQNWPAPDVDAKIGYWRKQLADVAVLDLPTDRPRPARQNFCGARQPVRLSASLTGALQEISRRANATLFMTLLAVFQTLLYRYSGQENIAVGSPLVNRERRELEPLIGFFINTLVLRSDFTGAPSFIEFLRRVREVCLDAQAYQAVPFEKIVEAVNPPRDESRHPLFQAQFVLQNTPRRLNPPAGLSLAPIEIDNGTSQFDLSLYLRERDGELIGYFEYASELFDGATMARMSGHFETLAQAIVAHPEQSIAVLSLMTEIERQKLLIEWNDTATDGGVDACIHRIFEDQVARTPNAVAIEFQGTRLTYDELNRRANRVAHYLRGLGVGPETLVGICVERSAEMVIALLAILKAGGAYVPIDPAYPAARQTFMLTDAAVSLLLTQKKLAGHLDLADVTMIALDNEKLFSGLSEANLAGAINSDNAAHVIYTSGSTGQPKGVIGLHHGAVNRFAWMWRRYPFRAGEVCCSKTSLSFVDSVWEIFGPLLQGVRLVIAPDRVAHDPRLLIDFLAAHAVSRIVLVPSLMKALLAECPSLAKEVPKLLDWTSSGEVLSGKLAEQFRKSHPRARLLNLYGSSEVAADVTCFEYAGDVAGPSVPIGRPIDNTQIYILDKHIQPVPPGVVGELYVGGAGVARGYWRRPELNAERFVRNPFSTDRDSRLFRSGDLARYLINGNIEYFGRSDGQIKLRGQRVELAEIEMVLRRHDDVLDCVVLPTGDANGTVIGDHPGPTSLIGYFLGNHSRSPSTGELRKFVRARLPEFMVPSAFVAVDHFPLLPNGKVDRRSLMAANSGATSGSVDPRPPRSDIEKQVAAIWLDLLHLKSVDIHDNFFALGGHSLLAVRLVATLRHEFDGEISLHEIFQTPTVAGIAAKLSDNPVDHDADSLPAIEPLSLSGKLPLSSSQELFWRLDELLSGADFLNLPYGYRLSGALDVGALRQSLQTIVERHATLRTVIIESNNQPVQSIRRASKVRLPLVDLSRLSDGEREAKLGQISSDDANGMFDLSTGPPFRVKLIRLAADEHVLLITLHHIVGDQWSMRLLRSELTQLYDAFAQGRPVSLPSLPFQFVDFVRWQRRMLDSGRFAGQFDYWKQKLSDPLPALAFGSRRRRPKSVTLRTARKGFELGEAQFSLIQKLARRQKTTPFVVLLAAVDVWLWRQTGCRDLRVGTLVANRGRPNTEKLIGYFINAVVLRGWIDARMTFVGLLRQLRRVVLDAFAHQDVPIAELSRALLRDHSRARQSLYQVMINYQRYPNQVDTAGGLTIASWTPGDGRAAVPEIAFTSADLNFEFRETPTKLTVGVNHRVDLFDRRFIERLADEFPTLLDKLTARPKRRLSSVTI